jgi:hypothetical protein
MLKLLRQLFIPHHSNNHRAKILHHQSLSVVIVFLLVLTFLIPSLQKEYPSVLGISYSITTSDLLTLTNQKRAEAGLSPLNLSAELSRAASAKAINMFQLNYWAHVAPDGTTPWYFIRNSGYEYLYAGENLARGFYSAPDVVNAWMASPSHRENILSPNYKDIGFAVSAGTLSGTETVLVVQEFGSRYTAEKNPEVASAVQVDSPFVDSPELSPAPTAITPQITPQAAKDTGSNVAAVANKPLVDSKSTTNSFALIILGVFIAALIIDGIYIERKKIVRAVSHNLDHALFLTVIFLAVIIIGRGLIL